VLLANNLFTGSMEFLLGAGEQKNNLITNTPGFVDAAKADYHLVLGSIAIGAGIDAGKAGDFPLVPTDQYKHPADRADRKNKGKIDVGAFAFAG